MQKVIDIDTLKDGKMSEEEQSAHRAVIADIHDENKEAQQRRRVTVIYDYDPTPDRKAAKLTFTVKSVLGRNRSMGTMLAFEKKGKDTIAHDEDPAQMKLAK